MCYNVEIFPKKEVVVSESESHEKGEGGLHGFRGLNGAFAGTARYMAGAALGLCRSPSGGRQHQSVLTVFCTDHSGT